jgi:hypothetical protein
MLYPTTQNKRNDMDVLNEQTALRARLFMKQRAMDILQEELKSRWDPHVGQQQV